MTRITDQAARIDALEGELRRTQASLRRTNVLALTMLGVGGVLALTAASDITRVDTIRAHQLEIIDEAGHIVLAATADDQGGRLDLWSPEGANVTRLSVNGSGGDIAVWNAAGDTVAGLWATEPGGAMGTWTNGGMKSVSIASDADGGRFSIHNTDEQESVRISSTDLQLLDPSGTERTVMQPGSTAMHGQNGEPRIVMAAGTAAPSLTLTHADGGVVSASIDASGGRIDLGSTDARQRLDRTGMYITDGEVHASMILTGGTSSIHTPAQVLRLDEHALTLTRGEDNLLRVASSDGHGTLLLRGAHGQVELQAGLASSVAVSGQDAELMLSGDETESVTLASGATQPVLQTSDEAIALHALKGAGRLMLGGGESGRVRLTGGADGAAASVDVLAPGGTRLATLSTTSEGHGLVAASDQKGRPVALLHATKEGSGRLAVMTPGGAAVASAAADGTPEVALQSTDHRTLAAMAATKRGGAINLMNAAGTPVVLAGITADGPGGAAAFQNGTGQTVVAAGSTPSNRGRIVVEGDPPSE